MAQPEPSQERSPRVRKDAKIALIVILALMVLVVVIWGRSPRVDEQAGVPRPPAEAPREAAPDPATVADADLARTDADTTVGRSAGFPSEGAMANQFSPDRALVRHDATTDASTSRAAAPADPPPVPAADSATPTPTPAPPRPAPITHTVARGDTLIKLAAKYYNDQSKWRLIQQANRGVVVLQIGQKLTIPHLPDAPARAADTTPPATTTTTPPPGDRPSIDRPSPSTPPARPAPAPAPGAKTYTVQKGDTFMKIARTVYRDPAKWRTLYERNRSKLPDPAKPDSLRIGTVLDVPAVASSN